MDYVREELARQRLALALLMMGERTREPVEERMGTGEQEPLSPAEEYMGTEERRHPSPEKQRMSGSETEDSGVPQLWRQMEDGGRFHGPRDGADLNWTASLRRDAMGEARRAEQAFHGEVLGGGPIKGLLEERQMSAGGTGMAGTGDLAEKMKKRENVPLDGEAMERTVTEILWMGSEETLGPGELSRTFQRDARRYDGSFSLY